MYNVSYAEWAGAGSALLDMAFRNSDACQFKKIGDDIKHWCLSEEGTCFKMDGMWERVIENFFPMLTNAWDLLGALRSNDICYSDEQLITEYATMWGDICKNAVIVHGMQPLSWNDGLEQAHVNSHEFHEEKKAYKAAHKSNFANNLKDVVLNIIN
jgi:hypothetical protein